MQRYANIVKLKPEKLELYKELHAAVWPSVLERIRLCNIRNYSIFHRDGLLFAYFEYHGDDYAADMAAMATDPATQEWWKLTDPCQEPLDSAEPGTWWSPAEEFFHTD